MFFTVWSLAAFCPVGNCWIFNLHQDISYQLEFVHSILFAWNDFLSSIYSSLLLILHDWIPKKMFLWTFLWLPNRVSFLFYDTITTCMHNSLHYLTFMLAVQHTTQNTEGTQAMHVEYITTGMNDLLSWFIVNLLYVSHAAFLKSNLHLLLSYNCCSDLFIWENTCQSVLKVNTK